MCSTTRLVRDCNGAIAFLTVNYCKISVGENMLHFSYLFLIMCVYVQNFANETVTDHFIKWPEDEYNQYLPL